MARDRDPAFRRAGRAFLGAFRAMVESESPATAAAISYFSLFALFPAILVLVALVDAFLDWIGIHETVLQSFSALFPGSRQFLASNLSQITDPSFPVVLSCLLAVAWSYTWISTFLENALNRAWGVSKQRSFWQSRLRGFILLSLCSVLLLASATVTGAVSAFRAAANARVPEFAGDQIINWLWHSVLLVAGSSVAVLVFFLVYKLMPDRKVSWVEALSGALLAALLWEVASYLFATLVPAFNYQRIYGRMGAVIALLVWVYTSSMILLFGAHFSAQLHRPVMEQRRLFPAARFGSPTDSDDTSGKKIRVFTGRT